LKLSALRDINTGKPKTNMSHNWISAGSSAPRQQPASPRKRVALHAAQLLGWVAVVLLLLSGQAADAHREHGVWTELVWSEDRFEITHHMHLQDAQQVLKKLGSDINLDSPEGLARLALYVEERFLLFERGKVARLDLIGAETEGDFLYVFQEWHGSQGVEIPQIKSTLLKDLHPDAVTWIRIEAPELNQTWSVGGNDSSSNS
jgi:hypothetical protein